MLRLTEITLAAGVLLLVAVVVGALYVLGRRLVRRHYLRRLDRRVERVQEILRRHERERFARVDRVLFQLAGVRDDEAVRVALQEVLDREASETPAGLLEVYEGLGLVDHFLERLEAAPRWSERAAAARSLGQLAAARTIPELVTRMRDPHEDVQTVKQAAAQALSCMRADAAIPLLLQELAQPDDWASPRLAELLLGFGESAREPLLRALDNDESTNARVWAAQILGRLGNRELAPALVARLQDRSEQVRLSVTEALGRLGDRRAIPDLTRMALRDPVPTVRAEAARALGHIGDPSVLGELVLLLSSSDYWTRLRAVEAIEKLRPEDTFALERALGDDSRVVRGEAARALERLGAVEQRLALLDLDDVEKVRAATESLVRIGRAGAIDSLLECAEHASLRVRARICSVLAEVGHPQAIPVVARLLDDPEWPVRARAAEAIGRLGPDDAVRRLVPALGDPEEMVRIAAIGAIQRAGAGDVEGDFDALVALFRRGNAEARCSVIDSLRALSTEKVERLVARALIDPNTEVRLHAVREARRRDHHGFTRELTGLLADADQRVRKEAARALGRLASEPAIEALAESLSTDDRDFREILTDMLAPLGPRRILEVVGPTNVTEKRLALAWALGKTGDPSALPELARLAMDPEPPVRAAAAGALAKIPGQATESQLSELLGDPNERVRSASVNAAGRLGATSLLVPGLLAMIDDPQPFVRRRLAVALGLLAARLGADLGDPGNGMPGAAEPTPPSDANPALIALDQLRERTADRADRAYVIVGYGLTGSRRGVERALTALRDGSLDTHLARALAGEAEEVRARFRENLALEPDTSDSPVTAARLRETYLGQLRSSRDDRRRAAAIRALEVVGVGEGLDVVLGVVGSDPCADVRAAAVDCLAAHVQLERAASALERALRDPLGDVRRRAVVVLAEAEDPRHNSALLACGTAGGDGVADAVVEALARANAGRAAAWVEELAALEDAGRLALGIDALGRIEDPGTLEPLAAWTGDADPRVRESAVGALGRMGTDAARSAIEASLSDPVVEVRLAATIALTELPAAGALDALLRLTRDPAVEVRATLAERISARESPQAIDVAGALAADPEDPVRTRALTAMLELGSAAALQRFLDDYPNQPAAVRRDLAGLPAEHAAVSRIETRAAEDVNGELRVLALRVLAALGRRPVPTLVRAMADPEPAVRLAAIRAAEGCDHPDIERMLARLARDPVREIRQAAGKRGFRILRHPSAGSDDPA